MCEAVSTGGTLNASATLKYVFVQAQWKAMNETLSSCDRIKTHFTNICDENISPAASENLVMKLIQGFYVSFVSLCLKTPRDVTSHKSLGWADRQTDLQNWKQYPCFHWKYQAHKRHVCSGMVWNKLTPLTPNLSLPQADYGYLKPKLRVKLMATLTSTSNHTFYSMLIAMVFV